MEYSVAVNPTIDEPNEAAYEDLDLQFEDDQLKYVRLMIKEEAEFVKRSQIGRVLYPCKCTAACSYQPIVTQKWQTYEKLYKEYQLIYDQFYHLYNEKIKRLHLSSGISSYVSAKSGHNSAFIGSLSNDSYYISLDSIDTNTNAKESKENILKNKTTSSNSNVDDPQSIDHSANMSQTPASTGRMSVFASLGNKFQSAKDTAMNNSKGMLKRISNSELVQQVKETVTESSGIKEKVKQFKKKSKEKAEKFMKSNEKLKENTADTTTSKLSDDYFYWFSDKTGATLDRLRNLAAINVDRSLFSGFFQTLFTRIFRSLFLRHHCCCLHCDFMEQSLLFHNATILLYQEYCEIYLRYIALWYTKDVIDVTNDESGGFDMNGQPIVDKRVTVRVSPEYHEEVEVVKRNLQYYTVHTEVDMYQIESDI